MRQTIIRHGASKGRTKILIGVAVLHRLILFMRARFPRLAFRRSI